MDSTRILIAMSNDAMIEKMRAILVEAGYLVIDQAGDGYDCLRKIKSLRPDISIIEQNLNSMSGFEVAKVALEDNSCDIMLIATVEQQSMFEPLQKYNNFISLGKPINKIALLSTLDALSKSRKKILELEKEINELKSTLDSRKEIEKAKGILMKNLGLSENDAFKRIQKQSMDKGIPMKEIAKAIILAYDI